MFRSTVLCNLVQYSTVLSYKQQITEQAAFYKKTDKRELKDFDKRVNAASGEICLMDLSMLKRCGELLEMV